MARKIITAIACFALLSCLYRSADAYNCDPTNNLTLTTSSSIANHELTKLWQLDFEKDLLWQPLLLSNGNVIVTTTTSVCMVNPDIGRKVWETVVGSGAIWNSVTGEKSIICFSGNSVTSLSILNGKQLWSKNLDYTMTAQPVSNGISVFLFYDKKITCLDLVSGNEEWTKTVSGVITQQPCIYSGKLYAACINGFLGCFDAKDGAADWETNLGDIATEKLVGTDRYIYLVSEKTLYAVLRSTGKPLWKYIAKSDGLAPTINGGLVFFTSKDKTVYCIDSNTVTKGCCMSTGRQMWSLYLGSECSSQPVASEGHIYQFTSDGWLYDIKTDDGDVLWKYSTGCNLSKAILTPGQLLVPEGKRLTSLAPAPSTIKIFVDKPVLLRDGKEFRIDVGAKIINGKSMIPARHLLEPFGGQVSWDESEKLVTCMFKNKKLELWVGKPKARLSGSFVPIDSNSAIVPTNVSGRVMVPARFIIEKFMRLTVDWDETEKSFLIRKAE